jgi:hypothetical protein
MSSRKPDPAEGHEGATESTTPGAPAERKVITPDWVAIQDDKPLACEETGPSPSNADRRPAKPAIDRHR